MLACFVHAPDVERAVLGGVPYCVMGCARAGIALLQSMSRAGTHSTMVP